MQNEITFIIISSRLREYRRSRRLGSPLYRRLSKRARAVPAGAIDTSDIPT